MVISTDLGSPGPLSTTRTSLTVCVVWFLCLFDCPVSIAGKGGLLAKVAMENNNMEDAMKSAGPPQTGSIIACAVVMLVLSAAAFGLRAYTRFFIVRVASYEEALVAAALVRSGPGQRLAIANPRGLSAVAIRRSDYRHDPASVYPIPAPVQARTFGPCADGGNLEAQSGLGSHVWTVTPESMMRLKMVRQTPLPTREAV